MKTQITYKNIWTISWPIILGSIAQNIITVTDTAFLGRLSEVDLGAGAIGGIFYLTIVMLGWGFGIGTQIIVARRYGENRPAQIGEVIEHAGLFLGPIALILFLYLHSFSDGLLDALLSSDAVLVASNKYLKIRSFGLFFAFFNIAFRALYIGTGRTKIISWSTLTMALVNIALNYVLIFGKLGFPRMGIQGAALASFIAEITASIVFILYTMNDSEFAKYKFFQFKGIKLKLYFRIIKVAAPVMFQNFFSLSVWFLFFILVESMGEHALAVSNIIRSIYIILMVPVWGYASATNTLVSSAIGEGRSEEVLHITWKITQLSVLSVALLVLLNLIAPAWVLGIYTSDTLLIADALPVLYIVSGSSLFIASGFIFFNAVSGTGKTQISLSLELVALCTYLVYSYSVLQLKNITVAGIWTAEFVYGSLLLLLSFFYLKSKRWANSVV